MTLAEEPLLTQELSRTDFMPKAGATYIYGAGIEERVLIGDAWRANVCSAGVSFVSVAAETDDDVVLASHELAIQDRVVSMRDAEALIALLRELPSPLYLDITGLTYGAWAPILRAAVMAALEIYGVYVEPVQYRRSASPAQGLIFDLSERIQGIAPLPGFVRLRRPRRPEESCFVPLLGFEGARFGYILDEVEPVPSKTVPVIGVPGFRPEYPFYAYSGNRVQLERDYIFSNARFAKANCPFDLYHELEVISRDFAGDFLRIAPIGTKPHGLGAVLFALSRPSDVELVYDHPVRRPDGTTGESRVCVYDIHAFVSSDLFLRRGDFSPGSLNGF